MFGEKIIIGEQCCKLDSKNRLYIPSWTGAEKGDEICLQQSTLENETIIKVYSALKYCEIFERLKKLRENATTAEDYLKYNAMIEEVGLSLNVITTIDAQRRITIPLSLMESSKFISSSEVEIKGATETVIIRQKK